MGCWLSTFAVRALADQIQQSLWKETITVGMRLQGGGPIMVVATNVARVSLSKYIPGQFVGGYQPIENRNESFWKKMR